MKKFLALTVGLLVAAVAGAAGHDGKGTPATKTIEYKKNKITVQEPCFVVLLNEVIGDDNVVTYTIRDLQTCSKDDDKQKNKNYSKIPDGEASDELEIEMASGVVTPDNHAHPGGGTGSGHCHYWVKINGQWVQVHC